MFENLVNNELLKRGINTISKLNIRDLGDAFNIKLYYCDYSTRLIYDSELYCILNNKLESYQIYEEFLHELAHLIFMGKIRAIKKREFNYIERKVNYLIPYIAIPKFALPSLKGKTLEDISEEFGVSKKLVGKRLLYIKNKGVRL